MRTLVIVSLIFAVCYLLTLPVFSTRWSLLGFRYLFLSGSEFLLAGFLLGPAGIGLIPAAVLAGLDPILHLALGWAGLVFGLQFDRRLLRLYPVGRYAVSFAQALATSAVAGLGAWWLLPAMFPELEGEARIWGVALLAIAAGPTSPSSIHYFSRVFGLRGRVPRLLKFVVAVDGVPAVLLLGVFAGLRHRFAGPAAIPGWQWLLVATALGLALGLLLTALVQLDFRRDELLLFVLGMVVLAGGAARYLGLSALFVSFVMGVTVANVAWNREEVHKVAAYAEKPIYLTFLVLAGSLMVLDDPRVPLLAAALVGLRFLGKLVGNSAWRWAPGEPLARSPFLGLALLSQGALAIVLAVEFEFLMRAHPGSPAVAPTLVSGVLVAILASEILSPFFIRAVFPTAAARPIAERGR